MVNSNLPKILVVSRGVWDDGEGNSSTLTNLFSKYDPKKIGNIYIETKMPNTVRCNSFFQISEFSLIHKIFHWNIKTGKKIINISNDCQNACLTSIAKQEQSTMNFVRMHRSFLFTFLREILWALNGWKTKELNDYILQFNPDIVFCYEIPLPLLVNLQRYIIKKSQKPAAIYLVDDFYSLKAAKGFASKFYIWYTRKKMIKLIKECQYHFAISPLMKKEYDKQFHLNCEILTKGIDFKNVCFLPHKTSLPISIVYMGNTNYDRISSLIKFVDILKVINKDRVLLKFDLYITNSLTKDQKKKLTVDGFSTLYLPVSYKEVSNVLKNHDMVMFVESLDERRGEEVRLSFSTKLVDYLSCSRPILAFGPEYIAPIRYLKENNSAFVASNETELLKVLIEICRNPEICLDVAKRAFLCAKKNHDIDTMHDRLVSVLTN